MEKKEEGKEMEKQKEKKRTKPKKLKVLVAVDGSEMSDLTVKRAGQYTKLADVDLTLLTVLEDVVSYKKVPNTPIFQERKKEAEKILRRAKKNLKEHGVECKTKIAVGPVASEIVRIAEEEGFTSIFMGSRGHRGLKRMLLGSVADEVIRHAHCPVTIIR
jgi:nucleotide-binding universal stress UspA family protein